MLQRDRPSPRVCLGWGRNTTEARYWMSLVRAPPVSRPPTWSGQSMVKRLVRLRPYDVRWAHKFMVLCFYDQTFNKVQYYCQELISLSIRIHGQSWDQTGLHLHLFKVPAFSTNTSYQTETDSDSPGMLAITASRLVVKLTSSDIPSRITVKWVNHWKIFPFVIKPFFTLKKKQFLEIHIYLFSQTQNKTLDKNQSN